jgi:hypothetical protein
MAKRPAAKPKSLSVRLDERITRLSAERARIVADVQGQLDAVDEQLAALAAAKRVVNEGVEAAYLALLGLGLIQEI